MSSRDVEALQARQWQRGSPPHRAVTPVANPAECMRNSLAPARTSGTGWAALPARQRFWADSISLNAMATPAVARGELTLMVGGTHEERRGDY
jgi:hypothetical protein